MTNMVAGAPEEYAGSIVGCYTCKCLSFLSSSSHVLIIHCLPGMTGAMEDINNSTEINFILLGLFNYTQTHLFLFSPALPHGCDACLHHSPQNGSQLPDGYQVHLACWLWSPDFPVSDSGRGLILAAVLSMRSAAARKKAFATCSSHLAVVGLFYGTLIFTYMRPKSYRSVAHDKVVSAFYTIFTPVLNPLIYSVRNKEVKGALRKWLEKHFMGHL
ncbi:olfactory receptor 2V2-like [Suricata suricatta]|uniref:olfactory receptor 2V2-like n=1 Tax=Suricata suricatta TaxID=37032 RepID=UPI00115539C8|nr:olfactory receptor 2V2-like [Suricata suricatta]